jgi:hypothetical protein
VEELEQATVKQQVLEVLVVAHGILPVDQELLDKVMRVAQEMVVVLRVVEEEQEVWELLVVVDQEMLEVQAVQD